MSATIAPTITLNSANLKTEMDSGPYQAVIAPLITSQDFVQIASILNDAAGAHAGPVRHADITGADLLDAVTPDVSTLTALQVSELQLYTSAASVHIGNDNVQAFLKTLFPQGNAPTANAAIDGMATRAGGRSEVLFGAGALVTPSMCQWAETGSGPQPNPFGS